MNREIFYNINQENTEIISDILKDIRKAIKKEFISIIKEKMETDLEIDSLEFKINTIKENIINKIYEDTKGSNKTLSTDKHDKRNFDDGVNEITFNKNEI